MRGLRLVGRGLRDSFEHLLPFIVGSVAWWVIVLLPQLIFFPLGAVVGGLLGNILVIFGTTLGFGPATFALMKWTDPRAAIDRPEWRDPWRWIKAGWRKSFALGVIVVVIVAILMLNLGFYGGSDSGFAILVPMWVFLIILTFIVGLSTFAALALVDAPSLRAAARYGGFAVASAPFQSLFLVLYLVVFGAICFVTVVPGVLLYPAIVATTVGRFVLNQLEIEIIDPMAPTDERQFEKRTGKNPEPRRGRFGR